MTLNPLLEPPDEQSSCSNQRAAQHYSYLLRLWRSGADGEWRASLQSVQNGERHMFVDLASLVVFLVDQLRPPSER
jgi:hypothetical protein